MSGDRDTSESPSESGVQRIDFEDVEFDDELALVHGAPFTGIITSAHPNGLRTEKNYRDGLPEGPQREWYPSGQLKEECIAIRGHGASTIVEWYENGQMKRRTYCRFGFQIRVQEWTQNGQLSRDARIEHTEEVQKYVTNLEKTLNITSWPAEEEPSRPS